MSGWISTKDRVPEAGIDVIAYKPKSRKTKSDREIFVLRRDEGGRWRDAIYLFSDSQITHWTPLPEPGEFPETEAQP